jgi:uncharacterized protein YggE
MKIKLFSILYCLPLLAFSATRDDPSVTVTGEASMRAPADRAYILFYSNEQAKSTRSAMKQSLQNVENTMETVKRKFGRKTEYDIVNSGIQQVGTDGDEYSGEHCIRVGCEPEDEELWDLIDDGSGMYMLIQPSQSISTGLPFSPIIYAVEDYKKTEDMLEEKALADARVRAEQLAKRTGKTVGEILSIQTGLIPGAGRGLDLPTPYISDNHNGVMMRQTITVTYQLLPPA